MELYVSALPYSVSEGQLEKLFSPHGTVKSTRVVKGRSTHQSRGYGFVVMSSQAQADKAADALNGTELQGRTIIVREARPQMIRKILCPTDYSSHSKAGIAYAIALAQENSAELLFLHVSSITADLVHQARLFYEEDIKTNRVPEFSIDKLLAQKTSQLNQFVRHNFGGQMTQLQWHADVSLGKVSTEIVRVAAQEDVDLIIVGRGKRRIMSGLLTRSISESISLKVRCPVVCISPTSEVSPWRGGSWPSLSNVPQFS